MKPLTISTKKYILDVYRVLNMSLCWVTKIGISLKEDL